MKEKRKEIWERIREQKEEISSLEAFLLQKRDEIKNAKKELNLSRDSLNELRDELRETEEGRSFLATMNSFEFSAKKLSNEIENKKRVIATGTASSALVKKCKKELADANLALERLINDQWDFAYCDDDVHRDYVFFSKLLKEHRENHVLLHQLEADCKEIKRKIKACQDELESLSEYARQIRIQERLEQEKRISCINLEKQLSGKDCGSAILLAVPVFARRNASR